MKNQLEQSNRPVFAGVDVGGTNIKVGLVSADGIVLASDGFATKPNHDPTLGLSQTQQLINDLLLKCEFDESDLVGVGLATPGPMDIPNGKVLTPFNLPGWWHQNVKTILSRLVARPVTFANDAGAAAFGEYWKGGGAKYDSIIMITLGTGVGGGIIINDKSIEGAHSHGAEIGHIIIDSSDDARLCSCGKRGHLEAYASATALVARCRERLQAGEKSSLKEFSKKETSLSALHVFQAAEQADPLAIELISEAAQYLSYGIVTLAHVIDPQAVLLGGAMNFGGVDSPIGADFLDRIQSYVRNQCFPSIAEQLTIGFATLGADAGFIGAAGMAKRDYYNRNDRTPTQSHN